MQNHVSAAVSGEFFCLIKQKEFSSWVFIWSLQGAFLFSTCSDLPPRPPLTTFKQALQCERGRGDELRQVHTLRGISGDLTCFLFWGGRQTHTLFVAVVSLSLCPTTAGEGQCSPLMVSLCHVEFSGGRLSSITLSVTEFRHVALQLNKHGRRSESRSEPGSVQVRSFNQEHAVSPLKL